MTRDVRRLAVGQVTYTAMCTDTGGMIDDATIFRLGDDNFRFVGGDPYDGIWLREQAERLGLRVWVKPSTDELHNLAVQGPASRDILREVVWTAPAQTPLDELTWFRFSVARIGGPAGHSRSSCRAPATPGELGYEVWCHPKDGAAVWDAIAEAGAAARPDPDGPRRAGHGADRGRPGLRRVRVRRPGGPVRGRASGSRSTCATDEDFVGRAALEQRRKHPQRVLMGLELEGNETAAHGDGVHVGRQQVGVVTSGTRSPILKKNIALSRMAVQHAEPGTEVEVGKLDGQQKRIPATVVTFPFYDPEKTRVRS